MWLWCIAMQAREEQARLSVAFLFLVVLPIMPTMQSSTTDLKDFLMERELPNLRRFAMSIILRGPTKD